MHTLYCTKAKKALKDAAACEHRNATGLWLCLTFAGEGTPDPDCRLYRKAKGREAKLCTMGHALMENHNGLAVGGEVTLASGRRSAKRANPASLRALARTRPVTPRTTARICAP
jgi:hypothetical protein